ncbi:MAG: replication endonuclease [Hydrogenobacter thermophilus]|uniref:rolling circle replication-associated protein n=1 Tax=Hydrogenobacter thermophilus TaxID=940 RepID=UPI001C74C5E5|nr:hypothetical protein [Hydrogenobacter thermophilus]QWK20213.1 MAG: replication endonuclease [Hydrogenobacter thermophilus]
MDTISYVLTPKDIDLLSEYKKLPASRSARLEDFHIYGRLYPAWYLASLSSLPVSSSGSGYRVSTPKLRYFRRSYYSWLRHISIPQRNWLFLTLTVSRDYDFFTAWANVGSWVSAFLNRMRNYFKKQGIKISYFWVIEVHSDGFPHVHVLVSFPFIRLEMLYAWWKDDKGKNISAFQGLDVEFIGRNAEKVKAYLLKYMVKSHNKYWSFSVKGDVRSFIRGEASIAVLVRWSTLVMWFYRIRLFGMSRDFLKPSLNSSPSFFLGFTPLTVLYSLRYEPYLIKFSEFLRGLYYTETLDLGIQIPVFR